MMILGFDKAIDDAIRIIRDHFNGYPPETTLIRDSFGILTVVLPGNALESTSAWNDLAGQLHKALGIYSPGDGQVLLRQNDLIDPSDVLQSPDRVRLPDAANTWLVDRLLTNQDWLREPLVEYPPIPLAVAFSIKGGVGRTTAFALWAWFLARSGKDVILVDLDLEAPGVAGLLLDEDRQPDYGLVDWLVEALVGQVDDRLLQECLADCNLASDEPGRIRVLPAFGKKTQEYVSKLGRVYMPTFVAETGKFLGLAERLLMLLERLADLSDRPDAVLFDIRAGLHDIGSAALTRLGAEAFLFARDDYQNWQAYRQLFQHLCRARSVSLGMADKDLRWRLKMVGAQVEVTESAKLRFEDESYSVWSELYDSGVTDEEEEILRESAKPIPQLFEREDENAPHFPLYIQFDSRVRIFDLINLINKPDWRVIETAFGSFFSEATSRLFSEELVSGK